MKINGNEIRPGNVIQHKDGLWVAVKTHAVKPGKGGAFNQVELKHIVEGTKLNERFRASETVERVRLEQKDYQFLYAEGDMLVFMDMTTYDQIELAKEFVGEFAVGIEFAFGRPDEEIGMGEHRSDGTAEDLAQMGLCPGGPHGAQ